MRINLILAVAAALSTPAAAAGPAGRAPTSAGAWAQMTLPQEVSEAQTVSGACAGHVVVERTAFLMGTLLRLEVAGSERSCVLAATEAALAEVARLEGVLSSWRPDSEVGRLNQSVPGEPWRLGDELWDLLAEARHFVALTGGAFDPGVGALLAAWELQGGGRVPPDALLEEALATSGLERLELDELARAVRRPGAGWWLDTGAFGKGVALRAAGAVLRAHGIGSALLDFGGQLLVLGGEREVGLSHPAGRDGSRELALRVGEASVATTSAGERFVEVDGTQYGHVLDPRTGRPVPAWGSVTVVAEDAVAADALSTALFVLGPRRAATWAAAHPEYGVVVQELAGADVVIHSSVELMNLNGERELGDR